jgi:hypothetical protein
MLVNGRPVPGAIQQSSFAHHQHEQCEGKGAAWRVSRKHADVEFGQGYNRSDNFTVSAAPRPQPCHHPKQARFRTSAGAKDANSGSFKGTQCALRESAGWCAASALLALRFAADRGFWANRSVWARPTFARSRNARSLPIMHVHACRVAGALIHRTPAEPSNRSLVMPQRGFRPVRSGCR